MQIPRVACLGPAGTFSEEAVIARFGDAVTAIPCETIPAVVALVLAGGADLGVVPLENSHIGAIPETAALLARHAGSLEVAETIPLPVRHQLLAAPGTTLAGVHTVISIDHAMAQCRAFLDRELPHARRAGARSTADAAAAAARTPGVAAIAGARAAAVYGCGVVAADIQDVAEVVTTFAVVRRTGH